MTSRRRVILAALVVFIAVVQVGVPVIRLFEPRPSRFGWQMYSGLVLAPTVETEDVAGVRTEVDVEGLVVTGRAEIYWSEPLARALCAGDIVAVVVVDRQGTTRVPCP